MEIHEQLRKDMLKKRILVIEDFCIKHEEPILQLLNGLMTRTDFEYRRLIDEAREKLLLSLDLQDNTIQDILIAYYTNYTYKQHMKMKSEAKMAEEIGKVIATTKSKEYKEFCERLPKLNQKKDDSIPMH